MSMIVCPNLEEVVGYNLVQYCNHHFDCSNSAVVCWTNVDTVNFKKNLHFTLPVYSYNKYWTWDIKQNRFKASMICMLYPEYLETIKKFAERKSSVNDDLDAQQCTCQNFLSRYSINVNFGLKKDNIIYFKGSTIAVYLIKNVKPISTCLSFQSEVSKCVICQAIGIDIGLTFLKKMVVFKSIDLVDLYAEQFVSDSWGLINFKSFDEDGDIPLIDCDNNNSVLNNNILVTPSIHDYQASNNNNKENNQNNNNNKKKLVIPLLDDYKSHNNNSNVPLDQKTSMMVDIPLLVDIYSKIGQLLVEQNLLLTNDRSNLLLFHQNILFKKLWFWLKTKFVGEKHVIYQTFPVSIVNELKYKGSIPYSFDLVDSKLKIENLVNQKLEKETKYVVIRLTAYQLSLISKFKIKIVFNIAYFDKIQKKWFPYFID